MNKAIKKSIFTIVLSGLGMMVLAMPVFAATSFLLSPVNVNVTEGQNFSVVIAVDPQDVKNYTVKVELEYPADLVEVKSFTLGSDWMALSQSGYDLIDNTNGVLVKTAGYPGGLSSAATFGTVSFLAKKAGDGIIKIASDSFVLNEENENVLITPLTETFVAVASPPLPEEEEILPEGETEEGIGEEEEEEEEEVISPEEEEVVSPEEEVSQKGSASMLAAGLGIAWRKIIQSTLLTIVVILCLMTLILIGARKWWLFRKKRKK